MMYHVLLAVAILIISLIILKKRKKTGLRQQQVKLVEKLQITHDTFLFTFLLQNQTEPLGLKVGEHIQIKARINEQVVERKYTPVSEVTKKGSFDLLIKIYRPCEKFPEGGKLTQWLEQRKIGDNITIKLPYGRFNYQGNGNVRITNFGNQPPTFKKVKSLFLAAGGTGITPLYQIIQSITNAGEDINMCLLFLNRTESDILLESELAEFCKRNPKLKVFYSVDIVTKEGWKGFSGYINKDKLENTVGKMDRDGLMCLCCGPPIFCNQTEQILRDMGVNPGDMFRF